MRKRTLARECALKILYAIEITKEDPEKCIENFWKSQDATETQVKSFADAIVRSVYKNKEDIDALIAKHATNWELDRMAVIDRNILRFGVCELLFMEGTPPKVAINEAIDIAKKYGDKDSGKFVNGILDKINKTEEKKA
ncbi:MAG: transcription antitermination factor NusB [Candidatus Omnitrophica bacterium]|nr:transcription antitermination factor NusB [Candidatus Omnitrophota bacterium]MCM8790883.1 transcription antitermination factor NusB [Candidatus Omnitrophota bacterium]